MTRALPALIVPVLAALTDGVRSIDGSWLGAWVYGSVALGAWDPVASDIDVIVVASGALGQEDIDRLATLHEQLAREQAMAGRLEVQYLTVGHLDRDDSAGYPCWRDSALHRQSRGDLNATTRWVLREHGIALFGPPAAMLPPTVTWDDVLAAMRANLTRYWPAWLSAEGRIALRDDAAVVFAVTTLCRILTTVGRDAIVTKPAALAEWAGRVPAEWEPLLAETRRLLDRSAGEAGYPDADRRAEAVQRFIRWATASGLATLGGAGSPLPSG